MWTHADYLALKSELATDPKHLGLTVVATDDEANANKLNAVAALLVSKRSLSTTDIFNAVDPLEHQALTTQQERWFAAMLTLGQIDPFVDDSIVSGLDGMFGPSSASRPAYHALLKEPGSRVTQMFQAGVLSQDVPLSPSDVATARTTV